MVKLQRRSGFTLIELLVVVIIVAILAAVGVPLLSANVQRARGSEAEAGLGTWRTGIRAFLAENAGAFPAGTTTVTLAQAGFNTVDLAGRWFNSPAYSNTATQNTVNYCISVTGANSTAPRADQVQGALLITRSINQDGTIFDAVACGGNALN